MSDDSDFHYGSAAQCEVALITLNACVQEQFAGSSTSLAPAFASNVHMPFMLHGAYCGPGQAYSLLSAHSQTLAFSEWNSTN